MPVTAIGVFAGALTLPVGALWALQRRMIYFPDAQAPGPPPVGPRCGAAHRGRALARRLVRARPRVANPVSVLVANGNAGGPRGPDLAGRAEEAGGTPAYPDMSCATR